ncbi:MAG TPA: hypothetical protein VGB14_00135 [Acidimicrobiales bacterium]|jgi:hypothetical protein
MKRPFRAAAVAAAVVLALLVVPATPASARTDNRSKPVLFLHGLDAFGSAGSDCNMWNPMINALRAWGHTGAMVKIKYYTYDTNCTSSIGSGDQNVSITTLGNSLAWFIWNNYTSRGITVDIVGHSMGGLITRSALAQAGGAGAPAYLYVEDVVTLATPHSGSSWAYGCGWLQCEQIRPGSGFLSGLRQNPQGSGGTDWTLIGSDSDGIVSESSATGMSAAHKVQYWWPDYGHSDYYGDTSDARDADVQYNDNAGWFAWYDAPRAVRWSDYALTYGSW